MKTDAQKIEMRQRFDAEEAANDAAMAKLKADIEALATEVRYSDGALNDFGGQHTIIANGEIKAEGHEPAYWPGWERACAQSFEIARMLSVHHRGDDVVLFWRIKPERPSSAGRGRLYLRLSFAVNGTLIDG